MSYDDDDDEGVNPSEAVSFSVVRYPKEMENLL